MGWRVRECQDVILVIIVIKMCFFKDHQDYYYFFELLQGIPLALGFSHLNVKSSTIHKKNYYTSESKIFPDKCPDTLC